MSTAVNYEAMKVGQLRALCKLRGLNADDRKEELIASLIRSDNIPMADSNQGPSSAPELPPQEEQMSEEEMRELSHILEEMRHMRKQWMSQAMKQAGLNHSGPNSHSFVHQGYGTSRK